MKAFGQDLKINNEIVRETFDDIKAICNKDNGELWGRNLWGPIFVVDRETRYIIANQPDSAGFLKNAGKVYCGVLPDDKIIANSTTKLWGTFWTMVSLIPSDEYERNALFIHESFHRLQPEIGLTDFGYENNHMDEMIARILLKLEWAALENSIRKNEGNLNLLDALIFRYYRRTLFPGSDSMENKFEIQEGLAEYTGHKLASNSNHELQGHLLAKHDQYWDNENLVRTFGYYSGFLYAFLLDRANISWRRGSLNSSTDLGLILKDSLDLNIPNNLLQAYDSIKNNYGYFEIYQTENALQTAKQAVLRKYTESFVNNPVLKIKLNRPQIGFNPNTLQPLDTLGVVFESIVISDFWGKLEVKGEGCLLSHDWSYAKVPAANIVMDGNQIRSTSWEMKLNDKWEVVKDGSNYYLKPK